MNPDHTPENDDRLAALFASANRAELPPDEAFLARLAQESATVFLESVETRDQSNPPCAASKETKNTTRRRAMLTLAFRGVVAVVAAGLLIAAGVWTSSPDDDSVPLRVVLDQTSSAKTLHLVVYRPDETAGGKADRKIDVWTRRGKLRMDEGAGKYTIAAGPKLWRIDEKANRATYAASPYFVDDKPGPDLLALLDLPELENRQTLLEGYPAERIRRYDRDLFVYRGSCPSKLGPIQMEVTVDATTRLLESIEATGVRQGQETMLGRLVLVSADEPVDEELFVVGDTLTEDGRIGLIDDSQGIVAVRPAVNERWTPLAGRLVLKPGDWIRTDLRGANAVSARLVPDTQVTIGPGSLVEMAGPREIRVARGEVKVVVQGKPVRLVGPDGKPFLVKDKALAGVHDEQLTRLETDPIWLQGFEGRTAVESMGSLVANVDGRNEMLTIGYHKVTVDIRDQIARTVVEESFVNHHPKLTLEGVFHFPLPQDASISGFGMWIGDSLVEADIVEKQRAREIYETILRENRDPGLLEWSGGNIFKARVFPIPAGGEKRIKITYTQVLPCRGNRYHYSYALKSELLRQTPLRELSIDVNVHSAAALAKVTSPTHMTRSSQTAHSARLEFSEQEYTPTRDFEVAVELDGAATPPVVLIPHRRGDDGYFMLQVTPPQAGAQPDRGILPQTGPLDLVVLADTSASMDAEAVSVRNAFIASLLGALTPADTFNLAVCDVDCTWAFDKPVPAEENNVDEARRMLEDRTSLGWTDLDKALSAALERAGEKTHIVYVGDGVVTGKDVDPSAFVNRLKQLHQRHAAALHAVSVSSSFEPVVMRTIGTLGGGSSRQITGEQGPQAAALELLGELAGPTVRDLKVEFQGLTTARVYPSQLPNLAAGTQQILLGRYLPAAGVERQMGQVVVTGRAGDKEIRLEGQVTLPGASEIAAGEEESFLPRLWARMHLDRLLEEGPSEAMRDEIIALSEEYHIMTPYTSLLVLESDEDRERFQVKRRFQMRDGEKYFQQGRDTAGYELVQQQMKRAGNWRIGLRQSILAQLAGMGRSTEAFEQQESRGNRSWDRSGGVNFGVGGMGGGSFGRIAGPGGGPMSSFGYGGGSIADFDSLTSLITAPVQPEMWEDVGGLGTIAPFETNLSLSGEKYRYAEEAFTLADGKKENGSAAYEPILRVASSGVYSADEDVPYLSETEALPQSWYFEGDGDHLYDGDSTISLGWDESFGRTRDKAIGRSFGLSGEMKRKFAPFAAGGMRPSGKPMDSYYFRQRPNAGWPNALFPGLAAVPVERAEKKPDRPWPAEAKRLAESLLRVETLRSMTGGLRIERQTESYDARWDELVSRSTDLALVSPGRWLSRSGGDGSQTIVNWLDEKERGVFSRAFELGRVRASVPLDRDERPDSFGPHMLTSMERSYQDYTVTLQPQGEGRMLLTLVHPNSTNYEIRILIDTARGVVLRTESFQDGKLQSASECSQFVELLDHWWPTRFEGTDGEGRQTSLVTLQYRPLKADELARQMDQELAGRDRVAFLHEPANDVPRAKQSLARNEATFEDRLVLAAYFQQTQQWERVLEHLTEAEALAKDKPGVRWIRTSVLKDARRLEEVRERILEEAHRLAGRASGSKRDAESLFLANYLVGEASGVCEANETLSLLDALLDVYREQPAHLHALRQWRQNRISHLEQAGQSGQALQLQRELALESPHDWSAQQNYAQALFGAQLPEEGFAWLDRVLVAESRWLPHEESQLREVYAEQLRQQGRYDELADYLAESLGSNPTSESLYQRYLSALLQSDRIDEANQIITRWLAEGRTGEKLPDPIVMRIRSATSQALGEGFNFNTNRLEERWLDPLSEVVRFFADHPLHGELAERIMNHHRFQETDHCRALRREAIERLQKDMGTLKPDVVARLVGWVSANDPAVEEGTWQKIAKDLRTRWEAEADADLRDRWSQTLVTVLSSKIGEEETVDFLRERWKQADKERLQNHRKSLPRAETVEIAVDSQIDSKKYRVRYASELFDRLAGQAWTAEYEDEELTLLAARSDADDATARLLAEVRGLHQLTDAMVRARYAALEAEREHPEKLDRKTLREEQAENLRKARAGFSDRLEKAMGSADEPIARWMNLEQIYLNVQLGRDLDKVAEECWEYLGPEPIVETPEEPDLAAAMAETMRNRYLLTLANLAARRDADERLAERLLAYCDRAIAAGEKAEEGEEADVRWKLLKYELLVALDRPEELERSLKSWIGTDWLKNYWRRALGYLLAEQGKIAPAVELFEAVRSDDELGPTENRVLADWYMVLGEKEKREDALLAALMTAEEYQIQNMLQQQLQPWRQTDPPPPTELDPDVLRGFAVLFRKSSQPQNYLYLLREFYQTTGDFRLPAGLADAVIGQTKDRVYPFLQGMDTVFSEIREEAAVDSIVERIGAVRQKAATDVDRRALDLLEVLAERRAAEMLNQPGPHAKKALTAMQRAFDRQWTPGEPRLMADLLANLGLIADADLSVEQLRQLRSLHAGETPGTVNRLHVAHALARTLWSYQQDDGPIDLLETSLAEYQEALDGPLPAEANGALDSLIGYLESRGRHTRGEEILQGHLASPAGPQQTLWLTSRLYQLYESALDRDGRVSLGSKAELYREATRRIQADLEKGNDDHRFQLVNRLCSIFRTVKDRNIADVTEGLTAFAFQRLPEALKRQTNNYQNVVGHVAQTLHDLIGPKAGLKFLIERVAGEPSWFRYNYQDGWNQHSHLLGQWRKEVGDLDELGKPLLALVTRELRQDLESRQSRNRSMYWKHEGHFWKEKASAFAEVAEEVYAERKQSGEAVKYIAAYLCDGLDRDDRGIEMLLVAHGAGLLDENGQSMLVGYLHHRGRYGESIGFLLPLVELRPDNIQYRVLLMRAYFYSNRHDELAALRETTDAHFRADDRWQEGAMAALADVCRETKLFQHAREYYGEVIALHQRTQPNRGIGDGTLSQYYSMLAEVCTGLGDTPAAVDAACHAVVSWGPRHDQRQVAINSLKAVLQGATDLNGYVVTLDDETDKSGLDNPLVRKALGQVYLERREFDKALVQLRRAVALQPNDPEIHTALVACFDGRSDAWGAVEQRLASLELSRRDVELYKDLGRRFDALEQPAQAERAYTSLVEMLPHESEGHAALAEIRQTQNRWGDAVEHWRQVAQIRALEPTGLLRLAEAQIHLKQWDEALATLRKLDTTDWPSRFGDVLGQVRQLERQMEEQRR